MNNRLIVFLVLLITFSSCNKRFAGIGRSKRDQLQIEAFQFNNLTTKAKFRYANGDLDISATANIRILKDSLIWLSVSPGLGIEAARGLITQDSIIIVNRLEKEFYAYNFKELSAMFNMDLNFHIVQSMLVGDMPFAITGNEEVEREDDFFLMKQQAGPFSINNSINRETMKLERFFVSDPSGQNTLQVSYNDFRVLGTGAFPFKSLISLLYASGGNSSKTIIEIEHSKADLDQQSLSFPFSIPKKYARR